MAQTRLRRSARKYAVTTAALLTIVACTPTAEPPQMPTDKDSEAVSAAVQAPDGPAFLEDIATYPWDDGGRGAAEYFSWVAEDAQSNDQAAASRAGETARDIASFVADKRDELANAPANPFLWQAFSDSLVPYLGALVGDETRVRGFDALDGLDSPMRTTTALFASMSERSVQSFASDAADRARNYERAFAAAVGADPLAAATNEYERVLSQAARLRSLIDTGQHVAEPESSSPTASHAQTQLTYEIASLSAKPGNRTIDSKFFGPSGQLLSPEEIPDGAWSVYDAQLRVYLAAFPPVNDAIRQFGRIYQRIANQ